MEILYATIIIVSLAIICQEAEQRLDSAIAEQDDWTYYNEVNF